jgi:hypothetical protein
MSLVQSKVLQLGSFGLLKVGLIGQQFNDDLLRCPAGVGFDSRLQSTRRIIAVVWGNPPAVIVVSKGPVFGDDQLLDDDFMIPRQCTVAWLECAQGKMAFPVDGATCNPSRGFRIGCDHSPKLDRPKLHWFAIRKADQTVDWIGCFLLGAASQYPSQRHCNGIEERGMVESVWARKLLQWSDSELMNDSGTGSKTHGTSGVPTD